MFKSVCLKVADWASRPSQVANLVNNSEMFHGTGYVFDKFKISKVRTGADSSSESWYGHGIYLSGEEWKAAAYAIPHGKNGQILSCKTSIVKPLVLEDNDAGGVNKALAREGLPLVSNTGEELTSVLRMNGYDSVVVFDGTRVLEVVVFNENAVKIQGRSLVSEPLEAVVKANPYHDAGGRFSTRDSANFVSIGGKFSRSNSRDKAEHDAKFSKAESLAPTTQRFREFDQDPQELKRVNEELNKKYKPAFDKLSPDERKGIQHYTGSAYNDWNPALGRLHAGHPTSTDKQILKESKDLINATNDGLHSTKAHKDMSVYKSMDLNLFIKDHPTASHSSNHALSKLIGREFQNGAIDSTSISAKVAKGFGGNDRVIAKIHIQKGTHGMYVGGGDENLGTNMSKYPGEKEFILPRGRKYKVSHVSEETIEGTKRSVVHLHITNPHEKMPHV